MFCRFQGINVEKLNGHMRSIVMQNANALKCLPRASLVSAAALLLSATMAVAAGPMPKEAGVWFDDTGKGAVKIEPCGTKLCGRIVWLKDLVNDKGEPLIDRHNPDSKLNTRPICGLQVVGQLEAMPEGGFDNGWIYDPKQGKSFSVAITLSSADELTVTGYKGVKFLSKTFTWKRAKTDLPSCAAAPTQANVPSQAAPAAAGATAAGTAAAAKTPAKAVAAPAAAPSAPAPTKPHKAGAAEALPWAGGDAAKPAAPKGASNLGAAKIQPPKTPATRPAVTKTSVTAPKAASSPAAKAKAVKPAAQTVPAAQKPAPIKPKPVMVEPLE